MPPISTLSCFFKWFYTPSNKEEKSQKKIPTLLNKEIAKNTQSIEPPFEPSTTPQKPSRNLLSLSQKIMVELLKTKISSDLLNKNVDNNIQAINLSSELSKTSSKFVQNL